MGQPYSSRHFFRRMPNALLARYFRGKGLFDDLDFDAMKPTKPDALLQAWDALPDGQRDTLEAELQGVHDLSDATGLSALQEAARDVLEEDVATAFLAGLVALDDHPSQAMTAFLDQPMVWAWAKRYHHADGLSYWKKRHNMAQVDLAADADAVCLALSSAICDYFTKTEGRGRNCQVEHYRRGSKDCFHAFPRDFSSHAVEWGDDGMTRQPHSPAFELVFVYEQAAGRLDLYCRGAPKSVRALQEIFATIVLRQESLSANPKDGRTYHLGRLMDVNFQFARGLDSGIGDVQMKKLRLSRRWRKGEHITLQAADTAELHEMLRQVRQGLTLAHYEVTLVELRAEVWEPGKPASKAVTFQVAVPNACSLKHEGVDNLLRTMLVDSGIEPKAPVADGQAA